jgi:lactate dehydrogenase-like 2-hydroxyacid dehydrogenase
MPKVLICDFVGLKFDADGRPDHSEIDAYVTAKGGAFHVGGVDTHPPLDDDKLHFFYQPELSTQAELLAVAGDGTYDAVIAAATIIPEGARFDRGGVRIGAGTGNMRSASWGGGSGAGGVAPLMNTPGSNSRATAQMVMKAVLSVLPDLPVDLLHERVLAGDFDTGRDLRDFPTEKLEGMRFAVLGFGNIGAEVARLAQAFHMDVVVYARPAHKDRIVAAGFGYADSVIAAAQDARVLSVHVGLGPLDASGVYANASLIDATVLAAMHRGGVVVNYDRGEVVDVEALSNAMQSGHISHGFIDADLFADQETGVLSGPLAPYIEPARRLGGRLKLLPHVAADTDHPSRVAGAKRAVDQIMDAICNRRVTNLVGALPEGYALGSEEGL